MSGFAHLSLCKGRCLVMLVVMGALIAVGLTASVAVTATLTGRSSWWHDYGEVASFTQVPFVSESLSVLGSSSTRVSTAGVPLS